METVLNRQSDEITINCQAQSSREVEILDNAFTMAIRTVENCINVKLNEVNIENIFQTINIEPNDLVDLIKRHSSAKYSLLLGCCYMLGRGISKNVDQAFETWKKDD